MTCYVDELRQWPTKIRCFQNGSCHLTADTDEELHEMAARIGMKRSWFQKHPTLRYFNHYDLTPGKREKALAAGAVFRSAREAFQRRRAAERVHAGD